MASTKKNRQLHLVYTGGTLKQGNSDSIEALSLTVNDAGILRGYFEIENLSSNMMVFKVVSNHPTSFQVLPTTTGYLAVNQMTRVKIEVRQGALLTGKERLRVSILEVSGDTVGKIRAIEVQDLGIVLKEFIDENISILKCFTFNVRKKAGGDGNKTGQNVGINGHMASTSSCKPQYPTSSTPIEAPGSVDAQKHDTNKLGDPELSSVSTGQDGSDLQMEHPRHSIKTNSGTSADDLCAKLMSKGMNDSLVDPLESDSMKGNNSGASAVVTDSGSCGSLQAQSSFLPDSSPDAEKGSGHSLMDEIEKERGALKDLIETLEERLESKNVEIGLLNEKLYDLNLEVERSDFRLKAKEMEVEQVLGDLDTLKEKLALSEKQAAIASTKLSMSEGNSTGRHREISKQISAQKTVEAGAGSTVQCPVTFEVLESKEVVLFKGDDFGNVFWSSTNLTLETPNGRRDYPIFMKILSRCNPDSSFHFEACFSPFKDFGVPEGINFGHCFLQLKFLNKLKQPKLCYHFLFDTCNGTCKEHSQFCQCREATFASGPFVSWGDLGSQDCWFSRGPGKGPVVTLELTVEVTVMLMKNSQVPSSLRPSMLADKLDHLITSAKNGDLAHFKKITFSCGRDGEMHYNFRELLLFDYSPVFRALVDENIILGPRYGPRVSLRNISNDTMEIFYKYVHVTDDGHWWDNVVVNLELLTFAQSFLIVELSIKCTANLLAMNDENLALDNVLAIIQTGRKYGMKCLEDRGIQWMNEKKKLSYIAA